MNKKTIGIIGGGQLGRFLGMEAKKLGFNINILDENKNVPAGKVGKMFLGSIKNSKNILELAKKSNFLTFETELADSQTLKKLKQVNPSPKTLELIKNKFEQKKFLKNHGLPVPEIVDIKNLSDLNTATKKFGFPFLLKAKFDAYDGRGNQTIKNHKDLNSAKEKLRHGEFFAEKFCHFTKEIAMVTAKGKNSQTVFYPLVETVHKNHICHTVTSPALVADAIHKEAKKIVNQTLKLLQGQGVFSIEMFLGKDGKIYINEIAPRVHNSGHLTMEAGETSQFKQHILAITGSKLGSSKQKTEVAVMQNILGQKNEPCKYKAFDGKFQNFAKLYKIKVPKELETANIFVHIYGKLESKQQRKMGHLTALGNSENKLKNQLELARKLIKI